MRLTARTEHGKTTVQRQIDLAGQAATDREIDGLVYELGVYPAVSGRLTEEEVKIVEG